MHSFCYCISNDFVFLLDRFYGGTNALKTRVAGAVCVKNIGIDYTDNVCQGIYLH